MGARPNLLAYFEDVKIERLHNMTKSGVLTQCITTVMHSGTYIDEPAHVVEGRFHKTLQAPDSLLKKNKAKKSVTNFIILENS